MKKLIPFMAIAILLFAQCKEKENAPSPFNTQFANSAELLSSNAPIPQTFGGDATTGFNFVTDGNLSFYFPSNAFKDQSGNVVVGNVEIEITEYLNKADMVFGDITTVTSTGFLLESGAMFKITARQSGQELQLNQTYNAFVPANQEEDMMLFQGIEGGDSLSENVVWTQPDSSNVNWNRDSSAAGSGYWLNLNFLSWCNLDRYYNAPTGSQVRLILPAEFMNSETAVYMIFDENSVVNLFADDPQNITEYNSSAYNLPNGWDIKLLAVTIVDEEIYYNLVPSTIVTNHLETINIMQKISEEDLEDLIKNL